jgi:hypothetical protein
LVLSFLAVFVLIKSFRGLVNRTFAFYSLSIACWSLFSILMITAPSEFWGTFWDRICLMGVVFIPSTFIHFNFSFLGINQKYRSFIWFNYLVSLFFFVMNFTPYFVSGTSPKFGLNYYTDPGFLYLPFVVYFSFLSALGVVAFYLALRKATGNRRRQIALLFWSTLLGFSMGGTNYNLSFGVGSPFLAMFGNYAVTFYGIVVAYTITKHRLMDISVVISRAVAEFLAVLVFGAGYLYSVWFFRSFVSVRIGVAFVGWTILYGILVGQFHQRIRLFFQTSADKLFLRGKYNYYRALSDASARVGEKLSLSSILKMLYDTFLDVVEISNPRIFLPENFAGPAKASDRYLVYDRSTFLPQEGEEEIGFDDPLVQQLIATRAIVHDPRNPERELSFPVCWRTG